MTSALITASESQGQPALSSDLESVGIHVLGATGRDNLVQEVLRNAPDLVVCYDDRPSDGLFASTASLSTMAPRPVVVFTTDPDADKIARATQSGIHAYVINGYGLHRLRSVIHLAQARFRHDQLLREELSDITNKFEERKLLDRAKGILMRARQVSEDEAFKILRTASMQSKQRIGLVSQQVIDAARYAEAVNRAGQLRMLSQRLVKLYALMVADVDLTAHHALLFDSMERVTHNLAILEKSLSAATFGDLLTQVATPWAHLRRALTSTLDPKRLNDIDTLAETFLTHAEQLTSALENAGLTTTLHVINVSGRQRMLSQRVAKQALLSVLLKGDAATKAQKGALQTVQVFEQSLTYLNDIPLSTRDIRDLLAKVDNTWGTLQAGVQSASTPGGQTMLAAASEAMLESFELLTSQYERSMQMLMG